jgi:hypothetical protein
MPNLALSMHWRRTRSVCRLEKSSARTRVTLAVNSSEFCASTADTGGVRALDSSARTSSRAVQNELESPFGESVAAGCDLMTARTDRGTDGTLRVSL